MMSIESQYRLHDRPGDRKAQGKAFHAPASASAAGDAVTFSGILPEGIKKVVLGDAYSPPRDAEAVTFSGILTKTTVKRDEADAVVEKVKVKTPAKGKRWKRILAFPAIILASFGVSKAVAPADAANPGIMDRVVQNMPVNLSVLYVAGISVSALAARRKKKAAKAYNQGKMQEVLQKTGSNHQVTADNVDHVSTLKALLNPKIKLDSKTEYDLLQSLEAFDDMFVYFADEDVRDSEGALTTAISLQLHKREIKQMAQLYATLGVSHPSARVQAHAREFLEEYAPQYLNSDASKLAEQEHMNRQFAVSFIQGTLKSVSDSVYSVTSENVFSVATARALAESATDDNVGKIIEALDLIEMDINDSELAGLLAYYGEVAATSENDILREHCKLTAKALRQGVRVGEAGRTETSSSVSETVSAKAKLRQLEGQIKRTAQEMATEIKRTYDENRMVQNFFDAELEGHLPSADEIILQLNEIIAEKQRKGELTADSEVALSEAALSELQNALEYGRYMEFAASDEIFDAPRFNFQTTGKAELDALKKREIAIRKEMLRLQKIYISFVIQSVKSEQLQQEEQAKLDGIEAELMGLQKEIKSRQGAGQSTDDLTDLRATLMTQREGQIEDVKNAEKYAAAKAELLAQASEKVKNKVAGLNANLSELKQAVSSKKLTEDYEAFLQLAESNTEFIDGLGDMMEDIKVREATVKVLADPKGFEKTDEQEAEAAATTPDPDPLVEEEDDEVREFERQLNEIAQQVEDEQTATKTMTRNK